MSVLNWSPRSPTHWLFSGNHFIDFIYDWVYLSTVSTESIAGQVDILQFINVKELFFHLEPSIAPTPNESDGLTEFNRLNYLIVWSN